MATASEVNGRLDSVSEEIAASRRRLKESRSLIAAMVLSLNDIPTKYSDLINTINAADYGANAYENANKAMLDALTNEYNALVAEVTELRDWINLNITEF